MLGAKKPVFHEMREKPGPLSHRGSLGGAGDRLRPGTRGGVSYVLVFFISNMFTLQTVRYRTNRSFTSNGNEYRYRLVNFARLFLLMTNPKNSSS